MNKVFLIITIFTFSPIGLFGQTPLYDAIDLKNRITDDSIFSEGSADILNQYFKIEYSGTALASALDDSLNNNPFLKKYKVNSGSLSVEETKVRKGLQSLGGLDVTTIADGLAKFMVERTKQELNAYFFDKFKEEVEKSAELRILFPHTSRLLMAVGSQIYNYNTYLTGLRAAFERDLSDLFVTFPQLIDEEKYAHSFDKFPELRLIVKTSFYIINELNNNVHPGEMIHNFPKVFGIDTLSDNIYNAVAVVDLFSQSLRSPDSDQYWLSQDSIAMLRDPQILRIYLGLVYQTIVLENKKLTFSTNNVTIDFKDGVLKPLGDQWNAKQDDLYKFRTFILSIGEDADRVNTSLQTLIDSKKVDSTFNHTNLYNFLDASIDLFDHSQAVLKLPYINKFVSDHREALDPSLENLNKYLLILRDANDLYLNTSERNYGLAISNVYSIMNQLFPEYFRSDVIASEFVNKKRKLDKDYPTPKAQNTNEYKNALKDLEKEKKQGQQFRYVELVLKYGSFMAAVVEAKTSDEVKEIIESTALPAGSSRIKRESGFNVAINSYLGFYAGHEWIDGVDNKKWVNNVSLSAPVGVSFSFGGLQRDKKKAGYSLGGFISFIDLGALASFRFGDDSTAAVSKIKLENIIAPGAFFSIGLPKTPFSINAGIQAGPLLRQVTAKENTSLSNGYWRVGVSFLVDIPLYNLYNREKKK